MKIKNILLLVSISLLSSIGCFAEEIKIDNPYENVGIQWNKQYHSKRSSISTKDFFVGNQLLSSNQADKVEIQVVLNKGTPNEVKIAPITYDASDKNRPEGQQFEENFTIGNKKGKFSYSAKVKYAKRGNHSVIKSIEVKISNLSVDEVQNSKIVTQAGSNKFCMTEQGQSICIYGIDPSLLED